MGYYNVRELGPRQVAHLNYMFFLILPILIITHLKKRSLSNDGVSKYEMVLSLAVYDVLSRQLQFHGVTVGKNSNNTLFFLLLMYVSNCLTIYNATPIKGCLLTL